MGRQATHTTAQLAQQSSAHSHRQFQVVDYVLRIDAAIDSTTKILIRTKNIVVHNKTTIKLILRVNPDSNWQKKKGCRKLKENSKFVCNSSCVRLCFCSPIIKLYNRCAPAFPVETTPNKISKNSIT